jgi:hypothetical protein
MKVAIISDQHFGCRKSSKFMHDYFKEFYDNVFFPYLEQHNIKTLIDMGDTFDNRKSIDFWALEWAKENYYDRLLQMEVMIHTIVGNHTAYYKNSNKINTPSLLLRDYPNIKTYSSPTNTVIDGVNMTLIPWICSENYDETMKVIEKSKSKIALGHLELNGFRVNPNMTMEDHGLNSTIFDKFERVYSGHYHTRSDNGKIFYLGNPYEMYWSDVNDTRGFHILDTETLEHTSINNPYRMFYNIYYEDTPHQLFDATQYENKIVKVIVRKKSKQKDFDKFIDKLYTAKVQELKIIENFEIQESVDFEVTEDENTLMILNRYIDESEFEFDKNRIKTIFQDIYKQASEVE